MELPLGPRSWPLLGALPQMVRDPLGFYAHMGHDFGPVSYARIAHAHVYLVAEPKLVEELLTNKQKLTIKDATTRTLHPLVGLGLLTSEGELWKRQRKLAAPAFLPKRLNDYEDTMVRCARDAFSRFADGERRDFLQDSMRVTLEVVGRTLLGISDTARLDEVSQLVDEVLAYYQERVHNWGALLPSRFPTPRFRRFQRAKAGLDALLREVIERVKRDDRDADHLLARLVRARGEDGQGMSEQQLLDEAVTMLLAGHETTALTLMYVVHLLSTHARARDRLREEIDGVLGDRAARADDLEHMPFLDAVIREALRLYPPAYAFGREVVEPFELGGVSLPKHAQLIVSPWAMHRNRKYWSEPEAFKPQRWLDGETKKLPRYVYMPFGGGHRICIGSHFAMLEAALLTATLMQQVTLDVRPGHRLELAPVVTLRTARGLPVTVTRR
ncbi:MAG TPA: cytochrome P450 [Polyangiales bacterium]|nr:cytochrome P450 [Polyangiales bacterium]